MASLIAFNDAKTLKAAGIPLSEDALRWQERTADQKGLRAAFIRVGRRLYVDPDRWHELTRKAHDATIVVEPPTPSVRYPRLKARKA